VLQFISLFLIAVAAGAPPPSAHCAATPFLLKKPVPHLAPAKPAAEAPKKTVTAAANKPAAPPPKPQAKPVADCDKPKKS